MQMNKPSLMKYLKFVKPFQKISIVVICFCYYYSINNEQRNKVFVSQNIKLIRFIFCKG
ncbi:hypothetical protein D3C87_624020 [compost metagenome]